QPQGRPVATWTTTGVSGSSSAGSTRSPPTSSSTTAGSSARVTSTMCSLATFGCRHGRSMSTTVRPAPQIWGIPRDQYTPNESQANTSDGERSGAVHSSNTSNRATVSIETTQRDGSVESRRTSHGGRSATLMRNASGSPSTSPSNGKMQFHCSRSVPTSSQRLVPSVPVPIWTSASRARNTTGAPDSRPCVHVPPGPPQPLHVPSSLRTASLNGSVLSAPVAPALPPTAAPTTEVVTWAKVTSVGGVADVSSVGGTVPVVTTDPLPGVAAVVPGVGTVVASPVASSASSEPPHATATTITVPTTTPLTACLIIALTTRLLRRPRRRPETPARR